MSSLHFFRNKPAAAPRTSHTPLQEHRRDQVLTSADQLYDALQKIPANRQRALAITSLEVAMFWALEACNEP